MYVSPEMRAFVQTHTKPSDSKDRRLRTIVDAILDKNRLGFRYQFEANLTASKAFAEARGNCMSFSFMTAALLREAGLEVYFHAVKKTPSWNSFDDVLTEEKHINLLVKIGFNFYEVDILPFQDEIIRDTTYLYDNEAYARFYNNLAITAITENNQNRAEAYLRKAVKIDYKCLPAWKNLGTLYRFQNKLVAAKQCLLRACSLNDEDETTYYLLAKTYRQMGNYEKSAFYGEKMYKNHRKSPLYYYSRYEDELAKNNLEDAEYYILKAIKKCPEMHNLYYALYRLYAKQDRFSDMIDALQKAKEVSKTDKFKKTYDDLLKTFTEQKSSHKLCELFIFMINNTED
jgi:tetratricopeptide (TPR) repeat protein